jgi:hypothetical protein
MGSFLCLLGRNLSSKKIRPEWIAEYSLQFMAAYTPLQQDFFSLLVIQPQI